MLKEAGVLHLNIRPLNELSRNEIVSTLLSACELWSAQLAETHIATEICDGDCSRETFIGSLLETYHFIKNFPDCLKFAADFAKGETKELITHYYHEEISHESFILDTLVKCGVSKIEVESSIPLVSTLGLINHLKNMFEFEPLTVLLVAAIIESADVDESEIENFTLKVGNKYNLEFDALSSYFEHVRVDSKMEHGKLASKNQSLLSAIDLDKIHLIVNGLHDLKHFFDLQKLEIKSYYNQKGNYLPRQFVDFFAI